MTVKEQVVHDRVNLVRLVRRLDKSVNETDWDTERSWTQWLQSERVLQQLKHARKLLGNVELDNQIQPSVKLGKRLVDIRGLLDRLDAYMLSVNERVAPEPSRLELFLPTVPRPSPSFTRKPDLPTVQRLAPPSQVTSSLLTTETEDTEASAAADVDLLLGSADESAAFLPPDRTPSTIGARDTGGDAASSSALLQNSTALQEELAAQLVQMAGQLRRNAEHFSGALAADQGVLGVAEEKVGANLDVMKRERLRLRDHRGKALGTTCLTISSLLVVAIAFLVMFFVIRFT
ncbi:hypothetical protein EDB85DRAFT_1873377 [Lactarius pseudohatsudake]|nr:hypothetical protein EDB85DRAFT_1873377 [Lactarius pseudohatsudake]